jgi:iron complex transport system substrate-binding protein
MLGRAFLLVAVVWSGLAAAAEITDATGRTVQVPDQITRVLPAGPPAAVLLAAVAPDLMIGWPSAMSQPARALLPPQAADLPQVPRLTGREDVAEKLPALKPDLILDYGTVSPRYADLARATQQKTGIPTILLDGSLSDIPKVLRDLGRLLHRTDRTEAMAAFADALLALPAEQDRHPRVVYARGPDGLTVAAPDTDVTAVFTRLDWHVLAPDGQGTFRTATIDQIAALDPDVLIFADPVMTETLAHSAAWHAIRAVQDGHAYIAPDMPFGWIEEPPSINRLLGLSWLKGRDPATIAALFNTLVYGRTLTQAQLGTVLAGVRSPQP